MNENRSRSPAMFFQRLPGCTTIWRLPFYHISGTLFLNELKDLFHFNPNPIMKSFKVKCRGLPGHLPAIASSSEAGGHPVGLARHKLPYAQLFHPVKFIQKYRPRPHAPGHNTNLNRALTPRITHVQESGICRTFVPNVHSLPCSYSILTIGFQAGLT